MLKRLLLCIGLLLCASSHGALLPFGFTATVTDINGVESAMFGNMSTGAEFSGQFIINTSATPHAQAEGGYISIVPSISFELGGDLYDGQSTPGVVDSYIDGSFNDFLQFSGEFAGTLGVVLGAYQFTFTDRDANAISSPSLLDATTDLTMANFFDNNDDLAYGSLFFDLSGNSVVVNFRVDGAEAYLVPNPAALWLLLSGLSVLGFSSSSRRSQGRNQATVRVL